MPPPLTLLLAAVWLIVSAAVSGAAGLTPDQSSTTLIQTVWGGGVSGNTPGNTNGGLGVASLSSAGPTAWMGSSHFDPSTSTFYLVDSGHNTSIKAYSPLNASGLVTYSSVPASPCSGSQLVKAVMADNSSGLWAVDSGCSNILYLSAAGTWTTALSSLGIDATKPASLAQRRDSSVVYASLSSSVVRMQRALVGCVSAGQGGCSGYTTTLVNTTAASNLALSFNEQLLYYIDVSAIRSINVTLSTSQYPVSSPTLLLLTGTGQSVVNPTALATSPDGLGLVIADLLPAGYSQIKYLNLSSSTVTTIGPNNVQSNCGNSSNTYQNGWIGGPACFGLIQQIITGTGTLGNQLLFFEVNTGRIRALDWSTQLMRTLIGGGPANNGFSAASNTPKGWAKGYGTESSLDRNLTGLVWDTTRNVGYVARQVSYTPSSDTQLSLLAQQPLCLPPRSHPAVLTRSLPCAPAVC